VSETEETPAPESAEPPPAEAGRGPRIRAFVALETDHALRARVADLVVRLSRELTGLRWVSPGALHLTLRFLGPSAPEALDRLKPALREAAGRCPAAVVRAGPLGMFPERGSPRVLWLALELPASVSVLQQDCERAAVAAGFPPESRDFRAHLTLARWKDAGPRPALPEVDLGQTALERLVLFRSNLRPTGAVHTPIEVFPLAGGTQAPDETRGR
jgi:2'-5' RNA ligase